MALDAAGNLLIADTKNKRVRVVAASTGTFYGQQMTAGDIYTIAGGGTGGIGDGGPTTQAFLGDPEGLTVEPNGARGPQRLGQRAGAGRGGGQTGTFYAQHMTAGDIYAVAGLRRPGFCCDGAPATTAQMTAPFAVTADAAGNVVIADINNNRIRVAAAATGTFFGQAMTKGDIYTVAGDGKRGDAPGGVPATQAQLRNPDSVAVDQAGDLLLTEGGGSDIVQMVPGGSGTFYGVPMTAGDIYTVAGDGPPAVFRGRRPGHQCRNVPPRDICGRGRELADRGPGQQPHPGGGRHDRHVLREGHDCGRHLHRSPATAPPGSPGTAGAPPGPN